MIEVGNLCEINGEEIESPAFAYGPKHVPKMLYGALTAETIPVIPTMVPGHLVVHAERKNIPNTNTVKAQSSNWKAKSSITISSKRGNSFGTLGPSLGSPISMPKNFGVYCYVYSGIDLNQTTTDEDGNIYYAQAYWVAKFVPNGTAGLVCHIEGNTARVLVEDKFYLVSAEKLKVIS